MDPVARYHSSEKGPKLPHHQSHQPPQLSSTQSNIEPQAEQIIAKEQAGFRAGRSTTEQILNLRIIYVRYQQHQQHLYHVFVDLGEAFD